MAFTTDSLTPVQKALLITLTGRALDACTERPILGDRLAAQVRGCLGSDVVVVRFPSSVKLATALRSTMLDRAVGDSSPRIRMLWRWNWVADCRPG